MCVRVNCSKCTKPTFKGCGKHVDEVLRDVPVTERCECNVRSNGDNSIIDVSFDFPEQLNES
jgi:hypothetical protein